MSLGPVANSVSFVAVSVAGLLVGIVLLGNDKQNKSPDMGGATRTERQQVSVNIAILYATLTLVISAVVSQWPPEGQEMLPVLEEIIFFGSVLVTSIIVGRVSILIYKLESELGRYPRFTPAHLNLRD